MTGHSPDRGRYNLTETQWALYDTHQRLLRKMAARDKTLVALFGYDDLFQQLSLVLRQAAIDYKPGVVSRVDQNEVSFTQFAKMRLGHALSTLRCTEALRHRRAGGRVGDDEIPVDASGVIGRPVTDDETADTTAVADVAHLMATAGLTPTETTVIRHRFGFEGPAKTAAETAAMMTNTTGRRWDAGRVKQVAATALAKLSTVAREASP
jgi:hypothetical protein